MQHKRKAKAERDAGTGTVLTLLLSAAAHLSIAEHVQHHEVWHHFINT